MGLKDAKLEEKEVQVVHGAIFADEFRNRQTGKRIEESSPEYDLSKYSEIHHFEEGDKLTEARLEVIKDGDIIVVGNRVFPVKKANLTTHYLVTGGMNFIADGEPYMALLSWDSADEVTGLTITTVHLALYVAPEPTPEQNEE